MNLFKKLTNSLLNLFNTIVSILTFGFIKLNKSIRKEFNVELLKAQLSDFELKRKEAKKENVEVRKESNNIKSTLYLPNGTDSSLNINEINEMYDDEIVRENAKSEFLEQFAPTISNESFTSIEEMEKFLEENK